MPLDTSIPLRAGIPQFEFPTAVSAADRQLNALRAQQLQQEMMRNQLIMQNTMEDRARAEENRRAAAAQAAAAQRQKEEMMRVLQSGYRPAREAVMGPGTVQGSTPAGYDFAGVTNAMLQRGNIGAVEELSKLQQQLAGQQKAEAEVPGVQAESRKKGAEAEKAEFANAFDQLSVLAPYIDSGAMPARAAVDAILRHPVAGKLLSSTMTREEMYDFADKNPKGVAKILATPPDKIYESMTAAQKTAVPQPATLPPGAVSVDMNPQSPTYGQVVARGGQTEQERKSEQQTKQLKGSINAAITSLEEMSKEGGLLDKATASGAGAAVDYGASVLGVATPGAIATGELQVLQDPILKMIPRFEGPQSDKDTLTYQQAAGQLANPNIPAAVRKAAAKTLIKLFKERQGQFAMPDLPEANTGTPSEFEGFVIKEK